MGSITNSNSVKHSRPLSLSVEFLRYAIVGGAAFLIDFSVLFVSKKYFLSAMETTTGILLATALGFLSGLVFNYIFSIIFVFSNTSEHAKQHKISSFVIFAAIGIAGLGITEFCMYAGILLLGQNYYIFTRIAAAGIVLVWNYGARKMIIFNNRRTQK